MIDTQPLTWSPTSWQSRPAQQQPKYASEEALRKVVEELAQMPPLVTSWEVHRLKLQFADAALGKRFLLQGGDCAESLADCTPRAITTKLKVLLQMSLVLIQGSKKLLGVHPGGIEWVDFFTCHEALHLYLRTGSDAPGAAQGRLVQPVGALPLDRHAHGRTGGRRARRRFAGCWPGQQADCSLEE